MGAVVRAVAVIPARGGSKGLPGKNLQRVGGRTLVARAVDACRASGAIDVIVVSSDDEAILAEAESAGARPIRRPASISGDTASSESAVVHALSEVDDDDVDVVVLVQCTSPFIDASALADSIGRVRGGAADVVFAAAPFHRFVWQFDADLGAVGVNHDSSERQRRQDRPVEFVETGAFYAMRREGFGRLGHRFFGHIVPAMCESPTIEIDEQLDLDVARRLVEPVGAEYESPVRAVVTDFDGVHTDNCATVDQDGREAVSVHRGDGWGIASLRRAGVPVLVLSTERNPVVARRAEKLGVDCVSGCDDKPTALTEWLREHGVDPADTVYVGNDENDAGCLEIVGWPTIVADAHPSVRHLARVVTRAVGGAGAVREVADAVLRSIRVTGPDPAANKEESPHAVNV